MIYVGIGSNLSGLSGSPRETCEAALEELKKRDCKVVKLSKWYHTEPVPVSDDPWFVNGVAEVETSLEPEELLETLHSVEAMFGRKREKINAPRVLDLDLIAYNDVIMKGKLNLPHRRMHTRAFVLKPLSDVAPEWKHPCSGLSVEELIKHIPTAQKIEAIDE